jgi:hypothetical protein
LTKLLWHNMYDPPCITPQCQAIVRMFLLGNVLIHWLHLLCTTKLDLDRYPSLRHFRNTATKRSSFHNTLLMMVHAIKNRSLPCIVCSLSSPITEGVLTRRNDTRTRLVTWGTTTTGATPKCNVKNGTQQSHQIQLRHYCMHEQRNALEYQCIELTQEQRLTKLLVVEDTV